MAEKGTNFSLKIGSTAVVATSTFTTLPGQQETELDFGGETIDTTDKSQSGWESKLRATRMATVTCSGVAKWPDTNGIRRLWTAFNNDPPECAIQVDEQSAGGTYSGVFQVASLNLSAGAKDVTRYSITLESVGSVSYA